MPDNLKMKVEDFVDSLIETSNSNSLSDNQLVGNNKLNREFGSLKGFVTYMADDFDAPLDEFKEYM